MSNNRSVALILLITAVLLLLMLPVRSQVYRDDFAYAQSVRQFVEFGEVKITEWAAPTLVLQVLWGGLFSKIFGFSLGALHPSVIVLLPIILICLFKALQELKVSNFNSLALTILFLSIPFILQFTYSFQTDIPFLTLEIISIFFFLKAFKEDRYTYFFLGTVSAMAGFLIRQLAIALILSSLVTVLLQYRKYPKIQLIRILLIIILTTFFILSTYFIWLITSNNQTITQISYQNYLIEQIKLFLPFTDVSVTDRLNLVKILNHRLVAMFSLSGGLFAIPLVVLLLSNVTKIINSINIKIVISGILIVFGLWGIDHYFFTESFVLGFPIDIYKYDLLIPFSWPVIWKYLVAIGVLSIILMSALKISDYKRGKNQIIFLLSLFLLFVFLSITSKFYWDRYIIVLLPFFIIFIGVKLRSLQAPKALLTAIIIILLIDSLQMNKARYDINGVAQREADYLIRDGIPPTKILPNQEEFWVYWYTFEDQIRNELITTNNIKELASIPPIPSNLIRIKYNNGEAYFYLNEYSLLQESDVNKIPMNINYMTLKEVSIRSLLVKTKLYSIKINNFTNYKNGSEL